MPLPSATAPYHCRCHRLRTDLDRAAPAAPGHGRRRQRTRWLSPRRTGLRRISSLGHRHDVTGHQLDVLLDCLGLSLEEVLEVEQQAFDLAVLLPSDANLFCLR